MGEHVSVFFRVFEHLLPRSTAWSIVADKVLRKLFLALEPSFSTFRGFIGGVWWEVFPGETNHLPQWETQWGIFVNSEDTTSTRRVKIDAAWKAQGGQSRYYIESVLQNAGFTDLFVHECWSQVGSGITVLTNGNFEDGDPPTGWTAGPSTTIAADEGARTNGCGEQILRVQIGSGITSGYAYQSSLTDGLTFRVTGWAKGDGYHGLPCIKDASTTHWTGSISENWQYFEFEAEWSGNDIDLGIIGDVIGTQRAWFDDVRVSLCWVARDPGEYIDDPAIGTVQCSAEPWDGYAQPQCSSGFDTTTGNPITQWQCDDLLANDPHYLVNSNLTRRAPPAIPEGEEYWPYFIYIGPETLTTGDANRALVPAYKRAELERLLLKHCPTQHWIVLHIDWIADWDVFDDSFDDSFE